MSSLNVALVRQWSLRAGNEIRKLNKGPLFGGDRRPADQSVVESMERQIALLLKPDAETKDAEILQLSMALIHNNLTYFITRLVNVRKDLEARVAVLEIQTPNRTSDPNLIVGMKARIRQMEEAQHQLFKVQQNLLDIGRGRPLSYPGGFVSLKLAAGLGAAGITLWWLFR